jgi:hypothetical protein
MCEEINWQGENDGGVLFSRDRVQCLKKWKNKFKFDLLASKHKDSVCYRNLT